LVLLKNRNFKNKADFSQLWTGKKVLNGEIRPARHG